MVDEFYYTMDITMEIRQHLAKIQDIARLSGRLAMDKAHAKDLVSMSASLREVLFCHELIPQAICLTEDETATLKDIEERIRCTLLDNPSVVLNEGGLIRDGYSEELDELRHLAHSGLSDIEQYAAQERELTGINLRLKQNHVVGFFFEINKKQADQLPERFLRKQSMMSGERFVTEKLILLQAEISDAKVKLIELEKQIFLSLVQYIKEKIATVLTGADQVALCDVTSTFAFLAHKYSYCCPKLVNEKKLCLKGVRHPIVESRNSSSGGICGQ